MEPIDYSSGDPAALASDERLLWSGTHLVRRGGCLSALVVTGYSLAGIAIVAVISHLLLDEFPAMVTSLLALCVGLAIALLSGAERVQLTSREQQVRLTDRRLVSRQNAKESVQLSHAELQQFELMLKRSSSREQRISFTASAAAGEAEDDLEDLRVQHLVIPVTGGAEAAELLTTMAAAGVTARAAKRRWRREWRPATVAEISPMASANADPGPPFDLVEGEAVLWQGRPHLIWRRDLAARGWALLKSLPWILGATAIASVPMFHEGGRRGAFLVLVIVACLVLYGQLVAHLWSPAQRVRRLRRTDYVLTTHRIVTRETGRRSTKMVSTFFDDDQRVAVELLRDGRGTLTLGYGAEFELVPSAAAVHALALRAVAGFRRPVDPPVAQPAT